MEGIWISIILRKKTRRKLSSKKTKGINTAI